MKGSALVSTYRHNPFATRLQVLSTSGFLRSNMEFAGRLKSMHSAAVRQGFRPPAPFLACVSGDQVNLVQAQGDIWSVSGQRDIGGIQFDVYHNSSQSNTLGDVLIQHGLHVNMV